MGFINESIIKVKSQEWELLFFLKLTSACAAEPRSYHIAGGIPCRERTSHSLVASLGGLLVTLAFKRRQLGGGPKAKWLKGLSSIMLVNREG